ncbi:2-aminoethylphosphonate aminotransferase [Chitinasiproducens palmae]|uniref:2-aminoethylphosphonate--pyruvate transaminase n=1 Tax=Chitinasiproducens palmae TaxID=1770053 RepID=A0A1H2PT94_9BURK|nr:2-aminoethylphosphonate aminotransferase [Chitinasiproducens palmae]SDV49867.1 2-aminoethylphosphonate-pyruvate transaminase [Chitinasiproducens palmae]
MNLLLNPGPVTLTERVRRSLLQTDLCHRENEFFDLQDEACGRLLQVYALDATVWQAILVGGSGTAAVESMIASLVPAQGRLLVVANGVYGERIAQMAARYGIAHETAQGEWMAAPDLPTLAAAMDEAARRGEAFTHLAVVQHETTTGRLTDIAALLALCEKRGIAMLLDGVSSFGAEQIDFRSPALAAVAATANKCLHGVPGIALVVARRAAIEQGITRAFYLDLKRAAALQAERNTPFTPPVHAIYALVEALREMEEGGGQPARLARYKALAERVRAGLAALGIVAAVAPEASSAVLRAYSLPAGVDYETLHDHLKKAGFVIYAGQGGLSRTLFRISTMGALADGDIERLLAAFSSLCTTAAGRDDAA